MKLKLLLKTLTQNSRGLTLIELLISMGIIVLLLAAGVPAYRAFQNSSDLDQAAQDVKSAILETQNLAMAPGDDKPQNTNIVINGGTFQTNIWHCCSGSYSSFTHSCSGNWVNLNRILQPTEYGYCSQTGTSSISYGSLSQPNSSADSYLIAFGYNSNDPYQPPSIANGLPQSGGTYSCNNSDHLNKYVIYLASSQSVGIVSQDQVKNFTLPSNITFTACGGIQYSITQGGKIIYPTSGSVTITLHSSKATPDKNVVVNVLTGQVTIQ